jgi:hypothetical protein
LRFDSEGILKYSPKTLGNRVSDKWWLIIECDPEIGRYVRHLYRKFRFDCDTMTRPAWREHITVIRNEHPLSDRLHLWEMNEGQVMTFRVGLEVKTNGEYFWLDIECDRVLDIREELGLPRNPYYPLHLSIGHVPQVTNEVRSF